MHTPSSRLYFVYFYIFFSLVLAPPLQVWYFSAPVPFAVNMRTSPPGSVCWLRRCAGWACWWRWWAPPRRPSTCGRRALRRSPAAGRGLHTVLLVCARAACSPPHNNSSRLELLSIHNFFPQLHYIMHYISRRFIIIHAHASHRYTLFNNCYFAYCWYLFA